LSHSYPEDLNKRKLEQKTPLENEIPKRKTKKKNKSVVIEYRVNLEAAKEESFCCYNESDCGWRKWDRYASMRDALKALKVFQVGSSSWDRAHDFRIKPEDE